MSHVTCHKFGSVLLAFRLPSRKLLVQNIFLVYISGLPCNSFLLSDSPTEPLIFCTAMRSSDRFPWELLKAECLRLVCAQLVEASNEGQNTVRIGRKEDMVAFLRDVHQRGGKAKTSSLFFGFQLLDRLIGSISVVKALEDVEPPKKTTISAPASPSKRKSSPVDGDDEDAEGESDNEDGEGYNTRYKGIKRVRVHGYSPEAPEAAKPKRRVSRPRKSFPEGSPMEGRKRGRPRKDVSTLGEQIKVSKRKAKPLVNVNNAGEVISRPRGRPRKNGIESNGVAKEGPAKKPRQSNNANSAPKSKDSGREVFDGIVLFKRSKTGKAKADGDETQHNEGDGSEEDAVLVAANGDAQGDLSSLGGSNKGESNLFIPKFVTFLTGKTCSRK